MKFEELKGRKVAEKGFFDFISSKEERRKIGLLVTIY